MIKKPNKIYSSFKKMSKNKAKDVGIKGLRANHVFSKYILSFILEAEFFHIFKKARRQGDILNSASKAYKTFN